MDKLKDGNYVDGDGDLIWVENNEYHRADGPAILFGKERKVLGSDFGYGRDGQGSWWWRGWGRSFDNWLDLNHTLSEEDKVMLKLKYG
jgi:hypothetical protein